MAPPEKRARTAERRDPKRCVAAAFHRKNDADRGIHGLSGRRDLGLPRLEPPTAFGLGSESGAPVVDSETTCVLG